MPKPRVYLGFDFGMQHIGVASGQSLTHTATPLAVLKAHDGIPEWETIRALIQEFQPSALIVGIPLHMNGTEQELTFAARKFAHRLQARFKLPIHTVDERLTTQAARRHPPNDPLDSLAAKVILEDWLHQQK